MKNFDELFKESAIVADRRKVIFNELIERTISDILPKFCKACQGFDISKVFFRSDSKCVTFSSRQEDEESSFFAICIDVKSMSVADAKFDFYRQSYQANSSFFELDKNDFLRTGIIEFVTNLNSRLDNYNSIYRKKNLKASEF